MLPDTSFYAAMAAGHLARTGHALIAHLETTGSFAVIVRECCTTLEPVR